MSKRLNVVKGHLNQPQSQDYFKKSNLKSKYLADPLDFMHLDELIPTEVNSKRKALRQALEKELAPLVPELYEKAQFPKDVLVPKFKALNILGLSEEKYGCRKVTQTEKSMYIFELSRIDVSLCTFYAVNMSLVIFTIEKLGSEEQKTLYLPKLVNMDWIGGWGLTEPEVGSDASSLLTTATPVEGGFLLNGAKRWIGNATIADVIIIFARNSTTNKVEGFIMDAKAAGVSIENIERKLALRIVQNGVIQMKDVFVPLKNRLEKAKDFASGANVVLEMSRMNVGWIPTGVLAGVYEHAVKYLRERVQFNAPLGAFQLNQEKLTRILGHFQACFLLAWRVTKLLETGQANIAQGSLVKSWTSLIGREAVRLGRELIGGNGIILDYYMIKALADMEVVYTYEGTYDINSLVVGRAITGIPAFKTGFKLPKS